MDIFIKLIIGCVLFFQFCSCTDTYTICEVDKNVNERTGFYRIVAGVEQVAYPPSFTLLLVGGTSPIYSNLSTISKFNLPLNPLVDSAKYQLFVYPNSSPDTVTFVYGSQPYTINPDCGGIYVFNLTRVSITRHHIDSAKIINATINNVSGENLKIYF